jgi:hypothetical protein
MNNIQMSGRILRKQGSTIKVDFYDLGVRTHVNVPFSSIEEAQVEIDRVKDVSSGTYGVVVSCKQ